LTSTIEFEKQTFEIKLRSPSAGFGLRSQTIERRKDPLLDRWCRINLDRANRPKVASGDSSIRELVEASRKGCPFCPENVESSTPMFPEELIPEGRLIYESAVVFPNLYPFGQGHAVVIFTQEHFLPLDRFDAATIKRGLKAAIAYFKALSEEGANVEFCSINWNHMPTAASSILHPHFQVVAEERPTRYVNETAEASARYMKLAGTGFWHDLVKVERATGERFIGDVEDTSWLASFAPLGNNEVIGVADGTSGLLDLDDRTVVGLAAGMSAVLRGYHRLGVQAFNASIYSGPLSRPSSSFPSHVRMISRPSPKQFNTADSGFLERLHDEVVAETMPESTALSIRKELDTGPLT
jgi:UDPglucose--hexose-1-phosphate uridylyltransferase